MAFGTGDKPPEPPKQEQAQIEQKVRVGQFYTLPQQRFVCRTWDQTTELGALFQRTTRDDRAAFTVLQDAILAGQCTVAASGERVIVTERGYLGFKFRRPDRDVRQFWYPTL